MQHLPARLDNLAASIEAGQVETALMGCHGLRGVAGSYGLLKLSREAERLEEVLRAYRADGTVPDAEARARLLLLVDAARAASQEAQP